MKQAKTFWKMAAVAVTCTIVMIYSCSKNNSTNPNLATLTTTATTNISNTSATSGGTITADGGHTVTARGICWSVSHNPTTGSSTATAATAGTGTFSADMTGLTASTLYYVRAWATNSAGTAYGNEVSFTTAAVSNKRALLTAHPWFYSSYVVTPSGSSPIDELAVQPCLTDDTLWFTTGMRFISKDVGVRCSPPDSSDLSWTFAANETELTFAGNGPPVTYTINTLNPTTLNISRSSAGSFFVFELSH